MSDDVTLLHAAIAATGLSDRRFAVDVLGVNERAVRYWLAADRTLPPIARIVCMAIVRRPALADELIAAHATLEGAPPP